MLKSRRVFMKDMATISLLAPYAIPFDRLSKWNQAAEPIDVHIFSKHLQFLAIQDAAEIAAELGFQGLDITVRPHGHVLPEHVKSDLPQAIRAVNNAGLTCDMITTNISDANNALDKDIIKSAAAQDIKYYRSNWYRFTQAWSFEKSLNYYQEKIRLLAELNKEYGIIGCYQNHAGTGIGSSFWEVKKIIETADPMYFGVQYDVRHAVVEGGRSWTNGLELLKDHIKTIVLKDFKWEKAGDRWRLVNVPIGEGMVDFNTFFKLLKHYGLNPPASLHLEYPLGGAEKGKRKLSVDAQVVFKAMKKDLKSVRRLWKNA
ncbi:MAG: sugar phosphate isomerase/epimerase family protein [Reichenbachiella sp.]|uniref:sugar phosphate isomerase/epimerase family protein n=1 Tax=Reichenbachiella sp. TaxID=2184521 RepID=UPI0032991691